MNFNVFRVLQRYALLFLLVIPGSSWSLGLGDATVESLLDYPLRVKIELLAVTAEELAGLSTKLASSRDFDWIGIERAEILNQLEFSGPTKQGDSVYFTVSSKAPIREPVLNFLVEAKWPAGRLLREYTIKLQPAAVSKIQHIEKNISRKPEPVGDTNPAQGIEDSEPSPQGYTAQHSRPDEITTEADDVEVKEEYDPQRSYRSVPGDTLSAIASKFLPEPLADNKLNRLRMMIAILETNPDAFISSNINGLKADAELLIPARQQIDEIDQETALSEVVRQNEQWRNRSGRRSPSPAVSKESKSNIEPQPPSKSSPIPASDEADDAPESLEPDKERTTEIIAEDEIPETDPPLNTPNEDTGRQLEERPRLQIVSELDRPAETGSFTIASNEYIANLERSVTLAQELAESRRQESEEIKSRIGRLESVITQQERLIALQNDQLSELNKRLQDLKQPKEAPESYNWLWFFGGVAAALIISLIYLLYGNLRGRKVSGTV